MSLRSHRLRSASAATLPPPAGAHPSEVIVDSTAPTFNCWRGRCSDVRPAPRPRPSHSSGPAHMLGATLEGDDASAASAGRNDDAIRDRCSARVRSRRKHRGPAQGGAAGEAGGRDALGPLRDLGSGLVRPRGGDRGFHHAVLGALCDARRAVQGDARQPHDAEPGRVVEGEPGRQDVRVQAARGPQVPQRRSLHRGRREVQLPAVQGRQGPQGQGAGRRDRRPLPHPLPSPRALSRTS